MFIVRRLSRESTLVLQIRLYSRNKSNTGSGALVCGRRNVSVSAAQRGHCSSRHIFHYLKCTRRLGLQQQQTPLVWYPTRRNEMRRLKFFSPAARRRKWKCIRVALTAGVHPDSVFRWWKPITPSAIHINKYNNASRVAHIQLRFRLGHKSTVTSVTVCLHQFAHTRVPPKTPCL